MTSISPPPRFLVNFCTFGVVRARWISRANAALNHRTGFLFAWLLQPFAHYGLAVRLNAALASGGSRHSESPLLCFLLTGWPLIGAGRRIRRAVHRVNDMSAVRQRVASAAGSA